MTEREIVWRRARSCAPFACVGSTCSTTCSEDGDCPSGVCNDDSSCCPVGDFCEFTDSCCSPTAENPGFSCCPAGCCDCFVDRDGSPFCCGDNGTLLCKSPDGDWTRDQCYSPNRYTCVSGRLVISEYVCSGEVVCDTPCCGGVCCSPGTHCSSGSCVTANVSCTEESDCLELEICATAGGETGTCCPPHRAYRNKDAEDAGAPGPYWDCCGATQEAGNSCDGNPYCRGVPDTTCTSIYAWGRR